MMALLNGHADAVAVLLAGLVVTLMMEWSLARRFAAHERVETKAIANLALTAETAASVAADAARMLREVRGELHEARVEWNQIMDDVRMHDRRLGAIEERFMRAAMMVTPPHRKDSE